MAKKPDHITLCDLKSPDEAHLVYKMYAKILKDQGIVPPEQDVVLTFGEYFDIRLNADGTWDMVW